MTKLNESQKAFAAHRDGPVAVISCPGSGKTQVVVARCASMIQSGIPAERILAVTFSKNGADEMNYRLAQLLGATPMRIGTFHSVGLQILTKECYGNQRPEVQTGRYEIAVKILERKYKKELNNALGAHEMIMSFISLAKAKGVTPCTQEAIDLAKATASRLGFRIQPEWLHAIYCEAEEERRRNRYITFDDMLFDTVLHFRKYEPARARWAKKWDYVIQDEAQDQNIVQHELCDMLSRDHKNVAMVADPQQTLYGFRGADAESVARFVKEYDAHVIRLEHNYRSGRKILALGEKVLRQCGLDPDGKLIATRDVEDSVRGFCFHTEQEEATFVIDEVEQLIAEGTLHHDVAILIRNGIQSLPFEATLAERKIPYHLAIGTPFYRRRDVATLLSYLKIFTLCETSEDWETALKRPTKYLTLGQIESIINAARKAPAATTTFAVVKTAAMNDHGYAWNYAREWAALVDSYLGRCADKNAALLLAELIEKLKYADFLQKEGECNLNDESLEGEHMMLLDMLIKRAKRFTVAELLRDVKSTLATKTSTARAIGKVTLTTVHRAKGLEWPYVYLCGVTKNYFPHNGAPKDDEARIFYVGVTRAKDDLTVTGTGVRDSCSKFIKMVPDVEYIDGQTQSITAVIEGVKYFQEADVE